jgi:hypothetical protein
MLPMAQALSRLHCLFVSMCAAVVVFVLRFLACAAAVFFIVLLLCACLLLLAAFLFPCRVLPCRAASLPLCPAACLRLSCVANFFHHHNSSHGDMLWLIWVWGVG